MYHRNLFFSKNFIKKNNLIKIIQTKEKRIKEKEGDFLKTRYQAILLLLILFLLGLYFLQQSPLEVEAASSGGATPDVQLMARAINGEARGEPYEGQVAVGAVILNRVKHSSFPNTIAGVIYESGAFTAVADGQINVPISEGSTVYKAARDAMNGWDPTGGAIYYFNPNTATNKWIWSRPLIKTIGKHRFCS